MIKKISGTILAAIVSCSVFSQDSTKSLTISGFVDAYYRFNGGSDTTGGGYKNNMTSFTNSANSFELGMASLRADASALNGKVTATVDLGFGNRAAEFSYNDGPGLNAIKQAFVTYAPSNAIRFTAGKFGTHVGYELLDPYLNRNYSMSYMFTNGPFFHTGIKADISAGPVGLMIGVANHVDQTTASNQVKNLLAQVSLTSSDAVKVYLNYWGYFGDNMQVTGAKSKSQVDLVVLGTISDKFNIGYNGTVQVHTTIDPGTVKNTSKSAWWGSALYLNADPTPNFGLTLRGEYIGDRKVFFFPSKNIFETTLSANYKAGPLTLIPELRLDTGGDDLFYKSKGGFSKSTFSALLAAIVAF